MHTCTSGLLCVICFAIMRQGLSQYPRNSGSFFNDKESAAEVPREQTGYLSPTSGFEKDHAHSTIANENYDLRQNSYGQIQPQTDQYEVGSAPIYQNSYASQEYNGQYPQVAEPQYTDGYDANSYGIVSGNHIRRPVQSKGHNPYPGEEYKPSQNSFHNPIQKGDNYLSIGCKDCGNGYKHSGHYEIRSMPYHDVPMYKNVLENQAVAIVTFKRIPRVVFKQVNTQVPVVRMVPRVVNPRTANMNQNSAIGH